MPSIQSVQGSSSAAMTTALASQKESPAQEAQESLAVTRREAAGGDQQAVIKLARLEATAKTKAEAPAATDSQASEKAAPAADGTGRNVNVVA